MAVTDQTIERVELDLGIVLAAVKPVEIGSAVDAEQHSRAASFFSPAPSWRRRNAWFEGRFHHGAKIGSGGWTAKKG
jgi:hypothetical protein